MAFDSHANFAYGLVLVAPSPATSGTSLTLKTGEGAIMPPTPFNGVVWPAGVQPSTGNAEIVRVTALSGDTLTIARTQEGSNVRSILAGDQFADAITAKTFTDIETAVTNVQGIALGALQSSNNLTDVASSSTALANLGGAPLASPALTGVPTAPTPTLTDNSTALATTAFVQSTALSGAATPTGQEWINVLATPYANLRWNTIAQSSADYFGGELQSDGTQNDTVTFQKYLQAGTYTMDVFYKTGATHGIITIEIDGTPLGTTIDGYVASGGAMVRGTIASITVTGSTVHTIELLMNTKNASASSYYGIVGGIAMTRTGN